MSKNTLSIDAFAHSLNSYSGRDKAMRTLAFAIQFHAARAKNKTEWLTLAKQLSSARLVLRQFNLPSQIKTVQHILSMDRKDKLGYACTATIGGVYTVYWVVELCAWLSDAKLLTMDAAKLFRYCIYLWMTALVAGLIKAIRDVVRVGWQKGKQEMLTLTALLSDFVYCIHILPHKVLWAGQLSPRVGSGLSLVSSLIGWSRTF